MNRRYHKWHWLLVLWLILALFVVKAPVEGGSQTLTYTSLTSPTDIEIHGKVRGTATYTGAPPTFTAELIDIYDTSEIHSVPVVEMRWFDANHWEVELDVDNVHPGHYQVKLTAAFSPGRLTVYSAEPGELPDCSTYMCVGN